MSDSESRFSMLEVGRRPNPLQSDSPLRGRRPESLPTVQLEIVPEDSLFVGMEAPVYYQRNLPHYQPPDASYLINIRLSGSLPRKVVDALRTEYENYKTSIRGHELTKKLVNEYRERQFQYFLDVDRQLDKIAHGPSWLRELEVASVVAEALHRGDGKDYKLLAYCIMPNHVHIVFSLGEAARDEVMCLNDNVTPFPVTRIMASMKKYTARLANKILGRTGPFWQHESYDHVIRDSDEVERLLWYVINNPVAAGLTTDWSKWEWTYCKRGLLF